MPLAPDHPFHSITSYRIARLVTCSPALSDDLGHLVDLSLGTAEGSESLLRELTGALVLAVTEEFDDTALVWGETGWKC